MYDFTIKSDLEFKEKKKKLNYSINKSLYSYLMTKHFGEFKNNSSDSNMQ